MRSTRRGWDAPNVASVPDRPAASSVEVVRPGRGVSYRAARRSGGRIDDVTPQQAARSAGPGVKYLGAAFRDDPRTLRRAREQGLGGRAWSVAGPASVLAGADAAVVGAALGLMAAEWVAPAWDAARDARPAAAIMRLYVAECRRWSAAKLDGFPATGRLADLAARVSASADATAMPLFAAWRSATEHLAQAELSKGARVGVLMHLLEQHRAGAWLLALRAAGLTPHEALVAGPGGPTAASGYGWPAPHPAPGPLRLRLVAARAVADRIAGQAYAVLDAAERGEFIELVRGAHELAALRTGELPQVRASEPARRYLRAS